MKEIKPRGIALQRAPWHGADGQPQMVVSGLLGFSLVHTRTLLDEDAVWKAFAQHTGERAVCDTWMSKPRGEVLLWGEAHSAHPVERMEVGLRCGPVSRRLQVSGERQWQAGLFGWRASDPTQFTCMPLSWTRSFGGPGWALCPVGVGADSVERLALQLPAPLPNIEVPGPTAASPEQRVRSVNLASVWPAWGETRRHGSFDKAWLATVFPAMPADFDTSLFNLAQPEQRRDGFWTGDEEFELQGLHPKQAQLVGQLPGVRMKCFVHRGGGVEEVPLRIDTVALFPSQDLGVLVYRGEVERAGVDHRSIAALMVAAEWSDHPRTQAHYLAEFDARRTSPNRGDFEDAPLMPYLPQAMQAVQAQSLAAVSKQALSTPASSSPMAVAQTLTTQTPSTEAPVTETPAVDPASTAAVSGNPSEVGDSAMAERDAVLDELSHLDYAQHVQAGVRRQVDSMRSLAGAIEAEPGRDIGELAIECLSAQALTGLEEVDAQAKTALDWREWVSPDLPQGPLTAQQRQQVAAQLRANLVQAEAALAKLNELQQPGNEIPMEELDGILSADGGDTFAMDELRGLFKGEMDPRLQALVRRLGVPIDTARATQSMQASASAWQAGVSQSLAAQGVMSGLLTPDALHHWLRSVAHGAPAAWPAGSDPLATALGTAMGSASERVPPAARKAFAEMAQTMEDDPDWAADLASVLAQAGEIRSVDGLLNLLDQSIHPPAVEPGSGTQDDLLAANASSTDTDTDTAALAPATVPGGAPYQDSAVSGDDGIHQLRADAVSEPVFPVPPVCTMLRELVQEQAAAGQSLAGRDFSGADLSGLNLQGIDLSGALLEGANLAGTNLRGTRLDKAVLINADLRQADLSGAQAHEANLRNVQAQGSQWREVRLSHCALLGAELEGADFRDSTLEQCSFANAGMERTDLSNTRCTKVDWSKALLRQTRISQARWSSCNLSRASLDGVRAEDAHFMFCDFTDATGEGMSLRGASLEGSRFLGVHLPKLDASHIRASGTSWVQSSMPGAVFQSADLDHALLSDALLKRSCFDGANLEGAVMNGARLQHCSLHKARLASAALRACDASGSAFVECDLQGTDLNGTHIDGCDFTQSRLHALQLRAAYQPT